MPMQLAGAANRSRSGSGGGNRYKKARVRSSGARWKGMGRLFAWSLYCGAFLIFLLGVSLGLLAAYRWMTNYPLLFFAGSGSGGQYAPGIQRSAFHGEHSDR